MAAEPQRGFEPWAERLRRRRGDARPWLILPSEPRNSNAHRAISYGELEQISGRLGRAMRRAGAETGARVLVIADSSAEACLLLLAALSSGLVAVPVPARGMSKRDQTYLDFIRRVCAECDPALVVGRASAMPEPDALPGRRILDFDQLMVAPVEDAVAPVAGDALAILQYTSGTTKGARGVELTHDNVFSNLCALARASSATADDIGVIWLPLFHDMGFIAGLLNATWSGMALVLITPRAFYMRPESWLWAIARFRGTCTAAPNSAYRICATQLSDGKLSGLDLSSLRLAACGAELVHPETVDAFVTRFASLGFRPDAFCPVYGLAEHTTAAAFPPFPRSPVFDWVDRERLETARIAAPLDRGHARARGVASLGRPLGGDELRIVGADGRELADREVGRVLLRGASVMRGYFRAEELSRQALTADGWLDTGDRGYVVGGELHLTGRDKHIIKRAGRTFDGDDVGSQVQRVPGVRGGSVAVFGVADGRSGTESLVVMAETDLRAETERDDLKRRIAEAVRAVVRIRPDAIALVRAGAIPRTSSGKVQLELARLAYLESSAERAGADSP